MTLATRTIQGNDNVQLWRCLRCGTDFIESGGDPTDWTPRRFHCQICGTVTRQERTEAVVGVG